MADPLIPATADTTSPAVAPQDAVHASPAAPPVQSAPAEAVPVPVPVPVAAPAVAEPVVAAPAAPAEPERTPTLLEKFDTEAKAAEAKAAEAKAAEKPAEPAKPTDAKPEAKPEAAKPADAAAAPAAADAPKVEAPVAAAPEPVDYKYTLPDTLKMDDALKDSVHKAFDEFRTNPAEGAQKLIDLHAQVMGNYAEETLRNQFKVFNDTKADWEKQVLADPEIGGAGHQTALNTIARVRDIGMSSAKAGTPRYDQDRAEFDRFLATTGAGSHPAFLRMLHNLARFVDEPQHSSLPANIKPPPSNGRAPGNRRGVIYDHPSSQRT